METHVKAPLGPIVIRSSTSAFVLPLVGGLLFTAASVYALGFWGRELANRGPAFGSIAAVAIGMAMLAFAIGTLRVVLLRHPLRLELGDQLLLHAPLRSWRIDWAAIHSTRVIRRPNGDIDHVKLFLHPPAKGWTFRTFPSDDLKVLADWLERAVIT